jgi:hypothetical protein
MRVLLLIASLFYFCLSEVFAQVDAANAANHVIIKYSPLPMFDSDNTIQFGVEVPLGKSGISLQEDLGYGHSKFNLWYQETNHVPNKATYKSRTHIRYYYFDRRRVRGYVGAEFLYKKVVYSENQWVGMECSGFGGCNFFENKDVKVARVAIAGHARLGWQLYFPSRLTLDFFTGIGMRSINVRTLTPGLENAQVTSPEEIWVSNTPGSHYVVPSLVLGVHLGIVLGKIQH